VHRFRHAERASVGDAARRLVRVGPVHLHVRGFQVVRTRADVEEPGRELRGIGRRVRIAVIGDGLDANRGERAVLLRRQLGGDVVVAGVMAGGSAAGVIVVSRGAVMRGAASATGGSVAGVVGAVEGSGGAVTISTGSRGGSRGGVRGGMFAGVLGGGMTFKRTRAVPARSISISRAAACERSTMRPFTNGPRSLMRTYNCLPLERFVTSTQV
jgi:hypothetical protein